MGLGNAFLNDLIALKKSGALDGVRNVIEIGDQQLADTLIVSDQLDEVARLFRAKEPLYYEPVGAEHFTRQAPSARSFWRALGLDHESIDLHGATTLLDLNRDPVPDNLRGGFDLVINAGTTEHLANQENAFRVIHDLTRRGGIMYHEVPAGGLIDHGFFAYQPLFFKMMAHQNDYEILTFKLMPSPPSPIPDYLQKFNAKYGIDAIQPMIDLTLRIAFRKRGNFAFSVPIDSAPALIPAPRRTAAQQLRAIAGRVKRKALRSLMK